MDFFLRWWKYYSPELTATSYFSLALGTHVLFRVAIYPALGQGSCLSEAILRLLFPTTRYSLGQPVFPGQTHDSIQPLPPALALTVNTWNHMQLRRGAQTMGYAWAQLPFYPLLAL